MAIPKFLKPFEATMFHEICNMPGGVGSISLEIVVGVDAMKENSAETKKSAKSLLVYRPLRCSQYEFTSEQATVGLLSVPAKTLRLPVFGNDLQTNFHPRFICAYGDSQSEIKFSSESYREYICLASLQNYPSSEKAMRASARLRRSRRGRSVSSTI